MGVVPRAVVLLVTPVNELNKRRFLDSLRAPPGNTGNNRFTKPSRGPGWKPVAIAWPWAGEQAQLHRDLREYRTNNEVVNGVPWGPNRGVVPWGVCSTERTRFQHNSQMA